MLDNQKKLNTKLREALDLLDKNLEEFDSFDRSVIDKDLKRTIMQLMRKNEEYTRQLFANFSEEEST